MKTSARSALVVITCLAAAVAACGGAAPSGAPTAAPPVATQPPASAVTVDACALLSDADIAALTGGTIQTTEPGPQAGIFPDGCRWIIDKESSMLPPEIVLGIMGSGGRAYYDKYFKPYNNEEDNEPIPDLGDEAVRGMADVAMVVVGDVLFQVQWLGQEQDVEIEIARKVAENLAK